MMHCIRTADLLHSLVVGNNNTTAPIKKVLSYKKPPKFGVGMTRPVPKSNAYPSGKIKIHSSEISEYVHGRTCFELKEYKR